MGSAIRRAVVPAMGIWLAVAASTVAADSDAIHAAIREMMTAARALVESGDRRDLEELIVEAQRVMAAGERTLAALPNPGNRHARDAADHVRRAMEHAKEAVDAAHRGQTDDAVKYARRTLTQVRRGAGHADAL